ncbi:MAG: methyltransferase domain-containing protein [Acidobacteriota bacterium]|nr:methyltransferase domain-containing protein [Acidobacteriota bacterium]
MPLALHRRFYADEIRVIAGLEDQALIRALSTVAREDFLGSPPWRYSSGFSLHAGAYRLTSDCRDLYHDVFVSLKSDAILNNGQPSIIARLVQALNLRPGMHVMHVGCGTGYYSAIMAHMVGPSGRVTAVEVDQELAGQAQANLRELPHVTVVHADAANLAPHSLDAVLINAGLTRIPSAWLNSLAQAGVIVAPMLVGVEASSCDAMVFRVERSSQGFKAAPLTMLTIYPAASLQDASMRSALSSACVTRAVLRVQSLKTAMHPAGPGCIAHTAALCLSADPPG